MAAIVRPWPVTPMNRTSPSSRASCAAAQRTLVAQRPFPLVGVHEAVELEEVDMVGAHPLERAADFLARAP